MVLSAIPKNRPKAQQILIMKARGISALAIIKFILTKCGFCAPSTNKINSKHSRKVTLSIFVKITSNYAILAFTRSRSSFPGLKCGTYLPCNSTLSPVLGLRPTRGARK